MLYEIMPPRMTTQSVGRSTASPRGGRTSGRTGRGSGRTRGRTGDQGNGGIDEQGGQVGEILSFSQFQPRDSPSQLPPTLGIFTFPRRSIRYRYQVHTLGISILPSLTSTPTILGLDMSS
ncbi:hypothetical protein Tco_1002524 [Tanacetum coccineum]|uniref:Uncharacterized protein n=1 Tax=Tanacetum coccineum TaxID=301880 RepID=A0ABQ5F6M1_9ASTR